MHPFNVNRAGKTRSIVNSMRLLSGDNRSETAPTPAERIVLKKFHSARYLHALKTAADGGKVALVLISFRNSKTTVLTKSWGI